MNEADYYVDLYRQRCKRMRYAVVLLLTTVALTTINHWDTQWRARSFYSKLPSLLYDFSQKYDKPLTEWWSEYKKRSPRFRLLDSQEIRFQSLHLSDTDEGVYWEEIPSLNDYLDPYQPTTRDYIKFLGWELPEPVFLAVAFSIPSALLFWLLMNARFLKSIAPLLLCEGTASEPIRLITQSIFRDRIRLQRRGFARLRAAALAASFFLLATMSSTVAYAPRPRALHTVRGVLYLTARFPRVSVEEKRSEPGILQIRAEIILLIVNGMLCAMIGRALARINTSTVPSPPNG